MYLQPAPGIDPVQWSAVIPNDIGWQIHAGLVLVLASLLSYGAHSAFKRWNQDGWISSKTQFILEIVIYSVVPFLGAFAGWLVWHWGTGLLFALIGGWSSPWVMKRLNRYFDKKEIGK